MKLAWKKTTKGDWHGTGSGHSIFSGYYVVQKSRKTGRWYLLRDAVGTTSFVIGDFSTRQEAQTHAEKSA